MVRGDEGVDRYVDDGLEVGAGIRQPATAWVDAHPGHRLVEPAFMQIQQAVAVPAERAAATIDFLSELVVELAASGFVADALSRAGQDPGLVASAPAGAPGD